MILISDTNILSSFAAGEAIHLLFRLFSTARIGIPPTVFTELQAARDHGVRYLDPVFHALAAHQIEVLSLSSQEEQLTHNLPHKLHAGERQAIALAQMRSLTLFSNDKGAVLYCRAENIRVLNLPDLLRLLWLRRVLSQHEVQVLIEHMRQVENLQLTEAQRKTIFAPRRHKQ